MRYRKLNPNGNDYSFGQSQGNFLRNTPDCVAQAVLTRLYLWKGDFFLNLDEGIDWQSRVLGTGTQGMYDMTIRDRILGTQGVLGILAYDSQRNGDVRSLGVQVTIDTIYGSARFPVDPPRVFVYPPPVNAPEIVYLDGRDGQRLDGLGGDALIANTGSFNIPVRTKSLNIGGTALTDGNAPVVVTI